MILHLRRSILPSLMLLAWCLAQAQSADQTPSQSRPAPESAASPAPTVSAAPADSTQLEVIKAPQPDYPLEAVAAGLQGRVWIQLHISENGDVDRTEIMGGDPLLAKAAESAMREWKFKPFIKDGNPVRVSRKVSFDFVLKNKPNDPCYGVETILAMNSAHEGQISQAVMEGALIHRISPDYPLIARIKHVQGKVILLAVIGDDGRIHNLKALCGPPELIPASLEAVQQWRYHPYMLEGRPTAVSTTIKVEFHM
ncbi:MAG TPA: energy transducer TonB [Candidatus Angelobacter sp.]